MKPVHGCGSTQLPGKGADNAMNEDETAEYSKCSSSLSSYSSATCESSSQTVSPVEVPVTQVMERPGDIAHDGDRIPASIFASKPSTPTAWSAASNDSLFSIQIGNLSFSRDHFRTMSEEKFNELFKSEELRKSAEIIRSRLHNESPIGKQHFGVGKIYEVHDETLEDSSNENFDQLTPGVPQAEGNGDNSTTSQQCDASGISCQPLTFPKKKKQSGWSLWPCSSHKWNFCLCSLSSFWCKWPNWKCCCTWPSCGSKWPTCGCKGPSSGCNWPCSGCKWPGCGCKWPSCGWKWPGCGCNWPGCGCNWPGCGCTWPSCSCCKWPSCSCCTWPSCSCCKWKSCSCCEWPQSCCKFQCPSFGCNCSSSSWSFCYPCNNDRRKKLCCISFPC